MLDHTLALFCHVMLQHEPGQRRESKGKGTKGNKREAEEQGGKRAAAWGTIQSVVLDVSLS